MAICCIWPLVSEPTLPGLPPVTSTAGEPAGWFLSTSTLIPPPSSPPCISIETGPALISIPVGAVSQPITPPTTRPISSNAIFIALPLRRFGGEPLGFLDRRLDGAHHVEGRLRQVVVFARAQALERLYSVGELDENARRAGEHLGDVEGLRQEALDL